MQFFRKREKKMKEQIWECIEFLEAKEIGSYPSFASNETYSGAGNTRTKIQLQLFVIDW